MQGKSQGPRRVLRPPAGSPGTTSTAPVSGARGRGEAGGPEGLERGAGPENKPARRARRGQAGTGVDRTAPQPTALPLMSVQVGEPRAGAYLASKWVGLGFGSSGMI